MANDRPRVLVTRSPHQSSELAEHLRVRGADPILIPAIEFTDPTSFAALDAALAHLDRFHWLLFTSANAVEAFHRRQESLQIRVPHLRDGIIVAKVGESPAPPRIAAIGPSTARALEAIGLTPDLIPPQSIAESFTEALLPHVHQPDGSPTRFLLVRAESAGDTPPREHLPETLRAAGAEVTIAPAYRTIIPPNSIPAIRSLFAGQNKPGAPPMPQSHRGMGGKEPSIDAITFTSSSTVRNLLALCEAAAVTLPLAALRISIGPITSQTLREAGYPPHAEAPEATIPALAKAVLHALKQPPTA